MPRLEAVPPNSLQARRALLFMSIVPLTLTISLCLVFTFVVFFLREQNRKRFGSSESDALLPLADEMPSRIRATVTARDLDA